MPESAPLCVRSPSRSCRRRLLRVVSCPRARLVRLVCCSLLSWRPPQKHDGVSSARESSADDPLRADAILEESRSCVDTSTRCAASTPDAALISNAKRGHAAKRSSTHQKRRRPGRDRPQQMRLRADANTGGARQWVGWKAQQEANEQCPDDRMATHRSRSHDTHGPAALDAEQAQADYRRPRHEASSRDNYSARPLTPAAAAELTDPLETPTCRAHVHSNTMDKLAAASERCS